MIRAARRRNLTHLHILLAELYLYNSLQQAALVTLMHIDDFCEALEDSQFGNHALLLELRSVRTQITDFRQHCQRAAAVTIDRLEGFFVS